MRQVSGIGRGRVGALAMGLVTTVGALAALPAPPAVAKDVTPTTRRVQLTQPADSFLGSFTPDATATSQGTYGPQVKWPLIPLQAVLEPNGKVVTYGSPIGVAAQRGLAYDEWDPAWGTSSAAHTQTPSMHDYDSFCSGMQLLSDGRILMVGGNSSMSSMLFDPKRQQQTAGPALSDQRWYASTLKRPDGKILVLGGANFYNTTAYKTPTVTKGVAMTPELGTGTSAWTALTGATSATAFGPTDNRWWYPRAYNAPNGNVVGFSANQLWTLDTNGKGSLKSLGTLPMSIGISGSSVMYQPGRILIAGGGQQTNGDTKKGTNAASVIDINGATPKVTKIASMKYGRNWLNLTVLANGEVLANGGTAVGVTGPVSNAVRQSEIFDPTTKTWRTGATAQRTRTYHSISLLMPSGVLTGGGGIPGPEYNMNAEMYYPSYLFSKGSDGAVRWADRVQINSLAGRIGYGSTLSLGMSDGRSIASASLTSLGVVTHSFNVDQRRVPVTIAKQGGSEVRVALPTDQNALPPGSYMLTVTDSKGVPSPAQIITIRANGSGQVTIFDKTEARGGGQSGDTTAVGVVDPTPGTGIGLEPYAHWGYRVRHDADGVVTTSAVSTGDELEARQETSFVVRRGLSDHDAVSFEAISQPGHYLAVSPDEGSKAVVLGKDDGSPEFAARSTFTATNGSMGQFTSFRLTDDPNRYLRQVGSTVVVQHDGTDEEREQTTFAVRKSLAPVPDEMAGPDSCCDPGGTGDCC